MSRSQKIRVFRKNNTKNDIQMKKLRHFEENLKMLPRCHVAGGGKCTTRLGISNFFSPFS